MLVFKDTTAVKKYMSYLQDQNDLAAVEQQHSGFTSMRIRLNKKQEEAEEFHNTADLSDSTEHSRDEYVSSRSDFPASSKFLSMMNAEGKVQIGNRIFKVTEDYVYEAEVGEEALLDDVDGSQSQHSRLAVHETQHSTSNSNLNGPEDDSCEIYAANPDYRMQGRIEYHNWWFFSEALVQTRYQEKQGWWFWTHWENVGNSDFYHNWDGVVWENGPSGGYEETVVGNEDEGSGAQLENQIYWTFGVGVLVGGDVNGYHEIDNTTLDTDCSTQT